MDLSVKYIEDEMDFTIKPPTVPRKKSGFFDSRSSGILPIIKPVVLDFSEDVLKKSSKLAKKKLI